MSELPLREQLVVRIQKQARDHLVSPDLGLFENYVEELVHIHTDEAFLKWNDDSLFRIHHGLFKNVLQISADKPVVRVFNPTQEEHGWESRRTVIYFCHPDMPFIIDSLRMALNRLNLSIHYFESNPISVKRDTEGYLVQVCESGDQESLREDHGFILVDALTSSDEHSRIAKTLLNTFKQVSSAVSDYPNMIERINRVIDEYRQRGNGNDETVKYLEWMRDDNFTFLGISDFRLVDNTHDPMMHEIPGARLGLMKHRPDLPAAKLSSLNPGFADFYRRTDDMAFAKSSQRSTVHRDTYPDYVVVKRYDDDRVIGETRFLGLYTAPFYHQSIEQIPFIRQKAEWLMRQSQLNPQGHNGKAYLAILENHPRDELIQSDLPTLLETTLSIWKIYERRTVKLYVRFGAFQKFVSCMVYIPRESLRTEARERIERLLSDALNADSSEFTTQFLAESVLARIYFVFRVKSPKPAEFNHQALEQSIAEIIHDWNEQFVDMALEQLDAEVSALWARNYHTAFPAGYRDRMSPHEAVSDLQRFHHLQDDSSVAIHFYPVEAAYAGEIGMKLFRRNAGIELSEMIPTLENLGFRVLVEHPYKITPENELAVWMQDFTLSFRRADTVVPNIHKISERFEDAFHAIWRGLAENDGFNRLVIAANLDWRQVSVLRGYARYLKQLGSSLSPEFIADTLLRHAEITQKVVELFYFRFDPDKADGYTDKKFSKRVQGIEKMLDSVESLNEDQVYRDVLEMTKSTLRTNYFQIDGNGNPPACLSFKVRTRDISAAPLPRPEYEIFVYSTRVEGVHLRGGKVARGGIRWSDRFEDYRTEVLGLVKAQQVKNAVIVPVGAKGGFIARHSVEMTSRESVLQEGLECYRLYISSLLDITDNRVNGDIIRPDRVVAHDSDDPYMVVAADKGTATYSDEANAISESHNHWLGDAFASGGSQGYDHKKMGITARGAWVAVQRHFRELGIDIQKQEFSAVGIGDMGGDVFGNGMLLSKKTRLLAAFNHLHIFVDPHPDAATSWKERKRLFQLPRSSWADYSSDLISSGGGVFSRAMKKIPISPEMAKRFDISESTLTPDRLIKALLHSKVDLIWNGGIGTYVKASSESHLDVGDRGSESVRLNGRDLRAKVFGEGGNLGMTQLGRIEFCQNGGVCNTDFIDNAAGVDCSDHEVNIKILLNKKVSAGELSIEERNQMLETMTSSVADLVLRNNYRQTLAISLARAERTTYHFDYVRFLNHLEQKEGLDRKLEYLPDDEQLKDLLQKQLCWSRPELAILLSHAKVALKRQLASPDIANDPVLIDYVRRPFPQLLVDEYRPDIHDHQLRTEIVATQLANELVNRMGFTFSYGLTETTGATIAQVARAYAVVCAIFDVDQWWSEIERLDFRVQSGIQYQLFHQLMRLVRRSTRWFLRNCRGRDTAELIGELKAPVQELMPKLESFQSRGRINQWRKEEELFTDQAVPKRIARKMASIEACFQLPGIVMSGDISDSFASQARTQFAVAETLGVDWMMDFLDDLKPETHWQNLALETFLFDLEAQMRTLAKTLCEHRQNDLNCEQNMARWITEQSSMITRFQQTVQEIRNSEDLDFSMFTVALSDLEELVASSRGKPN